MIRKYFHTLRYLKIKQIYYRIFYVIRNKIFSKKYDKKQELNVQHLLWTNKVYSKQSYLGNRTFEFLNQKKSFILKIKNSIFFYKYYKKLYLHQILLSIRNQ